MNYNIKKKLKCVYFVPSQTELEPHFEDHPGNMAKPTYI